MNYEIEFEREDDGRWIAEIPSLPGVMVYGASKAEAESKVEVMALSVIATPSNATTPRCRTSPLPQREPLAKLESETCL